MKFFIFFCFFSVLSFSKEITISAAASLKEFVQKNITEYKKIDPDLNIVLNTGSSGMLKKQVENGAPVDIIFLANRGYMKELKNNNIIFDETPILKNRLVLIKNRFNKNKDTLLAIGNPKFVPAGKYATEVLKNKKLNFEYKTIFCKDVRAVLTYVDSGACDYGIVYKTDADLSKNSEIIEIFDENLHTPIEYSIGIVKNTNNHTDSLKFLNFLKGKKW